MSVKDGNNRCNDSVEFPTKLELVINLKTAKAIGIVFPTPTCGCTAVVVAVNDP